MVRRRRRTARVVGGTVAMAGVLAVATGAVWAGLNLVDQGSPLVVRCSAEGGGTSWHLQPDQAETAALITAQTVRRGMPARAATIGIATGLQESKLRNIDYGDRDSVGIFQQRPSQGWGSVAEIMDPLYSTTAFLDALDRVPGYTDMEVTVAAQTVQRSGFPDAYAQHETRSRAWASALTGHSPAALTCTLPPAEGPGDAEGLVGRAGRDFGGAVPGQPDGSTVRLSGTQLAADAERGGWAVAHWAVAVAEPFGVESVHHAGRTWTRDAAAWSEDPDAGAAPAAPGEVLVRLAEPQA